MVALNWCQWNQVSLLPVSISRLILHSLLHVQVNPALGRKLGNKGKGESLDDMVELVVRITGMAVGA